MAKQTERKITPCPYIFFLLFGTSFFTYSPNAHSEKSTRAYFNNRTSSQYYDPYRKVNKIGDNLESEIVDFIKTAKSDVSIAIQELRLPKIAHALVKLKESGVRVRVVLENSYNQSIPELDFEQIEDKEHRLQKKIKDLRSLVDLNKDGSLNSEELLQRDAIYILRKARVPIVDDTEDGSLGSGLMHHKFIIVDQKKVIVSSANFTLSGVHGDFLSKESIGNANSLISVRNSEMARFFQQEFNLLWGDGPRGINDSLFGSKKPYRGPKTFQTSQGQITVQFSGGQRHSPTIQSTNNLIVQEIAKTTESIHAALFVFSKQAIANQMRSQRYKYNTEIQLIGEKNFAYRNYSEFVDIWGLKLRDINNCKYETKNSPWSKPVRSSVSVARMNKGDIMHHKFAVLDKERVIFGSHNWSDASETTNDETLVVIKDNSIAEEFLAEFKTHYERAYKGPPQWFYNHIEKVNAFCMQEN